MQTLAASLGARTGGAIALAAAKASGLTHRQLHRLVASGRWQSPLPRVYVTFNGPIPAATMHHAAVLYAGTGAVLSHETAACFWQLCRAAALIHVTVPFERAIRPQPQLVVHRSRGLCDDDVHRVFRPPRTTIERTVLDLLASRETADRALGLVADALRTALTSPTSLRAALERHPKTRWRKVVNDALPDLSEGAQSPLEVREARLRRRHGLPAGRRQASRRGDGTEYLDILIEEWRLHIELDGRLGHDRAREVWRDMRRDNRSELLGLRQLRYGWGDVVDRPCYVAIEEGVVLRQQGWTGTFRRCRDCPTTLPAGL